MSHAVGGQVIKERFRCREEREPARPLSTASQPLTVRAFPSAPSVVVTTRRSGTWRDASLRHLLSPPPGSSVIRGDGLRSGGRSLVPGPSPPCARPWGSHRHWVSVPSPVFPEHLLCADSSRRGADRQSLLAPAREMDRKQACL